MRTISPTPAGALTQCTVTREFASTTSMIPVPMCFSSARDMIVHGVAVGFAVLRGDVADIQS